MKSYFISYLAAAIFVLWTGNQAGAQKMITFESRSVTNSKYKKRRRQHEDDAKNSVTMGFASLLNGYIPVYYERTIAPMLTVQVGAGFTFRSFMNDIGATIYEDGYESDRFDGSNDYDINDDYASYRYRKMKMGQYLSLAPRLYFRQSALNGAYIGPMVEYKNYRYAARLADVTANAALVYEEDEVPRASETLSEQMRCIDFTFNFGGHFQAANHVALGFNIGIGGRDISAERLDLGRVTDQNGKSHFVNATHQFKTTRPLFVFNFIVGGWF